MYKVILSLVLLLTLMSCQMDWRRGAAQHVKRFQSPIHGFATYGTGFNLKVRDKVYVITNKHVCKVSEHLGLSSIAVVNGEPLVILKISEKHDLCVLTSNDDDGFELADNDVEPLDQITLIGHPRGLDIVIREGRIISEDIDVNIQGQMFIADMISATSYPGNSGSPVLNDRGRVVGVLFAGSSAYPHEPLTVPYEFLKEFVESL